MAKNSIPDFSATAASNTDIQSVNIDENCPASGINNAIRELMADLKNMDTGAVALTSPQFATASMTGDLTLGDNDKAVFGAGSDLQIYHDASNSYVSEQGTGSLNILASNQIKLGNSANDEVYAKFNKDGNVELRHNNTVVFETTSSGVSVTGGVVASSGLSIDSYGDPSNNFFTLRPGFAPSASGGVGFAAKDHDGANNDGLGVFGHDGISFTTGTSEAMRLDSSGNFLVGKTASGSFDQGSAELNNTGYLQLARDNGANIFIDRQGSSNPEGAMITLHKAGTEIGRIGVKSDRMFMGSSTTGLAFEGSQADSIYPISASGEGSLRDNAIDLGFASSRFDDVFATNGTIQTSDENEKQNIAALTSAEMTAAKAISALFKTYKWKDKVTAKGDAARTHTGVVAQEVQAAMSDAGLDASKYAFWCSDTWWEVSTEVAAVEAVEVADAVYDDDGNEVSPAVVAVDAVEARDAYTRIDTYNTESEAPEGATKRTRLGVRYPELLAFIGAATEQRLADIETRLAALEA